MDPALWALITGVGIGAIALFWLVAWIIGRPKRLAARQGHAGAPAAAPAAPPAVPSAAPDAHPEVHWVCHPHAFVPTGLHTALGFTAEMAVRLDQPWDALTFGPRFSEEVLRDSWGITKGSELLTQMSWLLEHGHRAEFDAERREWDAIAEAERGALEQRLRDAAEHDSAARGRFWRYRQYRADARGVRALDFRIWDLTRVAFLARCGAGTGLISDELAETFVRDTATGLQPLADGWGDFGRAYVTQRWYWMSDEAHGDAEFEAGMRRVRALLAPQGPWARVPYGLPPASDGGLDPRLAGLPLA